MGDKNLLSSSISTSSKTSTQNAAGATTSMYTKTLSGVGNLIKLLPTGTVFLFQFLNPVVTNTGHCNTINKYLSGALLVLCGFSCVFSSFTDSYTGTDGQRHYGIVTTKGLWPSPASENLNLSVYKLRFGDFVHGLVSLIVFAVLGLLDTNTVMCFYPDFQSEKKLLLEALPPVIGAVASAVFMAFPCYRHGIGYPTSTDSNDTSQKSDA